MHGHPVRNDESHESRGVFFKLFDFVNFHAEDRHENKSPRTNSCYPDDVHKLSTKDFARGIKKNIKPLYKLNMAIDKNIKKTLEKKLSEIYLNDFLNAKEKSTRSRCQIYITAESPKLTLLQKRETGRPLIEMVIAFHSFPLQQMESLKQDNDLL